jgi:acetyl esterase/lipase
VPVRCYWPEDHAHLPVVLFFHGGGFVLGDLDTADAIARRIAVDCNALVVSVDYRLAPEHPFPAAPLDAIAVYTWLLEAAPTIGGDPARVAVAGESSGANLAAVLCHAARDRGLPLPVFQMLWYPNTDTVDTPARRENAEAPVLNRAALHWLEQRYLARGTADAPEAWAAPAKAASFHGLPPALVTAGQYDPLRDDGERYAQLLRRDGVNVAFELCPTMPHGFLGLAETIPACRDATLPSLAALRRAVHRPELLQEAAARMSEGSGAASWLSADLGDRQAGYDPADHVEEHRGGLGGGR